MDALLINILNVVLLGALFLLQACSTTTPLTKATDKTSVVDFTIALRSQTSAGLDNSLGAGLRELNRFVDAKKYSPDSQLNEANNSEVREASYTAIATWWCPRHKEVSTKSQVINQYIEVCNARRGKWNNPYCEDDVGQPLFLAAVTQPQYCSGGYTTVAVYVVEPTFAPTDTDYLRALKASQFVTQSTAVKNQQTKAATAQQQEKVRQEVVIANASRILNEAQRGSKVCSIDSGLKTIAFVLDRAPLNRFEVRIHDVVIGNGGYRPNAGGVYGRPGDIIFISPAGWGFCD